MQSRWHSANADVNQKGCIYIWTCSKNRQDCQHQKNAQFDKYAITSNPLYKQMLVNFYKKFENYVTNLTTKIFFIKVKATQEN